MHSRVHDIKRAQKEKMLFRVIANLFSQASIDDPRILGVEMTRVELSPSKGHCTVYFYCPEGVEFFNEKLQILKLYKPSLRAALSKEIASRYTPEIAFRFDALYEKQQHMEKVLNKVSEELKDEDLKKEDGE